MPAPQVSALLILAGFAPFLACSSERAPGTAPAEPRVAPVPVSAGARDLPRELPHPAGWGTEVIAFPLPFAPELPYRGTLDLRFTPGMFKEGSEQFWSYAFAWWLDGQAPTTADQLNRDLTSYFQGLYSQDPSYDRAAIPVVAKLSASGSRDGALRFVGSLDGYDPFRTHQRIALNVEVRVVACAGRSVVLFKISPQPASHEVWSSLAQVVDGARC